MGGSPRVFFTVAAATDDEERKLLPFLLAHALRLGIAAKRFVVVLHAPEPTSAADNYGAMAALVEDVGAPGHVKWTSAYSGAAKEAVRRRVAFAAFRARGDLKDGDWVVHADSDEFVVFDEPLGRALARAATHGFVVGAWTDRVATGGALAPVPPPPFVPPRDGAAALFAAFPLNCAFRRKPKVVAYRIPLRVTDGAHDLAPTSKRLVRGGPERTPNATATVFHQGRKRVTQRRFDLGVLEATPNKKASTL